MVAASVAASGQRRTCICLHHD